MAVNGTHNTGEEWKQKTIWRQDQIGTREGTVEVHLYNDATDALSDSDDVGAISTEPGTGNYSAQSLSLDSTDVSLSDASGDARAQGTVTFDVTDTGETVDGYYITAEFQSDVVNGNAEGSANTHIIGSATFGTEDLSNYSSFDVTVQDTLN